MRRAMRRPFIKMHGLGNDFVVFDARAAAAGADRRRRSRALADRHTGIGCDQLILLEPSRRAPTVSMRIWNADGGEVEACGNATRCVATLLGASATIETAGGLLEATATAAARDASTWAAALRLGRDPARLCRWIRRDCRSPGTAAARPFAVNVGNPHIVFFVDDAAAVDLAPARPADRARPAVPRTGQCRRRAGRRPRSIRLRVWERGAGLTRACGTGACATRGRGDPARARRRAGDGRRCPAASRRSNGRRAARSRMTGPAAACFTGEIDLDERTEVINFGCRLNAAESESASRALARRRRPRHRQQLRGHRRGGAPGAPGDPQGAPRPARRADRRHRLRRADRPGRASRRCPRSTRVLGNREKLERRPTAPTAARCRSATSCGARDRAASRGRLRRATRAPSSRCRTAATIAAPSASSPMAAAIRARCPPARSSSGSRRWSMAASARSC